MAPAINKFPNLDEHFYRAAIQYYSVARFSVANRLTYLAGNLFHHAVEMLLKGRLTHAYSVKKLRDANHFAHDLGNCWAAFKALFPTEDLSGFDKLIAQLHAFESIRYPDNLVKSGAHITIGFVRAQSIPAPSAAPGERVCQLPVTDIDALMNRLFPLCGINPEAYVAGLGDAAIAALDVYNVSSADWFPNWKRARK
jgi:hypothetical protein